MEVHSPSNGFSAHLNHLPRIPIRTPIELLDRLHSFYADRNIEKFRNELDSLPTGTHPRCFDIHDLDTLMIDAIRRDDPQFTMELLHRGLPLDPDYVLEAAKSRARSVLEMFFNEGWDINKPISEVNRRCLDPNQQCAIDLTPLSHAVKYAPVSIIRLLLRHGGNVQQGQLLFHALDRKSEIIAVLQLLLREGASIDATMYQNHYASWRLYYFMGLGTVLHKAAELGNVEAVQFLLNEGIDLSIQDANGRTALECAEMLNKVEVVEVLKEAARPKINH
ncbi:hypothetical protein CDV55_102045 [Aspergillus turcosus]|uniref:Uncharacterized protein n=1 Tax=Aspergillus turcosus TaxID=1245748 RepID=A0A229WY50_9EURO|nr:hypothetical protein CDV55_102045 [Aspergillus turcosus]RLL94483.1 hypothetical protein CFD26_103595 [Aspergillus turcosus]